MAAVALAATAGGAWAQPAVPPGVEDTSFVEANGDRVLQLSAVIDAPGGNAWRTFITAEGWKQLGVQMAAVDFRVLKPGAAYDDFFVKFLAGNAYTLDKLRKSRAEPAPR
jgi:hypothetical protein